MALEPDDDNHKMDDTTMQGIDGHRIESDNKENMERNLRQNQINWKIVFLEAGLLFIATQIPIYLMDMLTGHTIPSAGTEGIGLKVKLYYASIAIEYIGFVILGCLHRSYRFRHLFAVALILWGLSCIRYVYVPFSVSSMVTGFIYVMVAMFVGGSMSLVFLRLNHP